MRLRLYFVAGFYGLIVGACSDSEEQAEVRWPLACDFVSFESPADITDHCAARDAGGTIAIRPDLLAAIASDSGVQSLHVDGSWFFAIRGKAVPSLTYDNGADYFEEGLARTVQNGKLGFVDENLDLVVAPGWDFAFPFKNGFAVVCTGCREQPDGEHTVMTGGGWGYIDRAGNVVVEPIHERDSLPPSPE